MNDKITDILKGLFWGTLLCFIISLICGCNTTKYVPIHEYHTSIETRTDSVILRDTIEHNTQTIVREVDSLTLAQYGIELTNQRKAFLIQIQDMQRQISKNKEVSADTVVVVDSIDRPVYIEVEKKKTFLQHIETFVWLIIISSLFIFLLFFIFRSKK